MKKINSVSEFTNVCNDLEGILVGVPKGSLSYKAELYFIKQNDEGLLVYSGYNCEDATFNGVTQDSHPISPRNMVMDFDMITYYQFEDLKEFCRWYLQQQGDEIWTSSGDLKGKVKGVEPIQWINECYLTHTPVTTETSKEPRKKRRDVLKDVIEYIRKLELITDCEIRIRNYSSLCLCNDKFHQELAEYKDNLEKWLDEEVEE